MQFNVIVSLEARDDIFNAIDQYHNIHSNLALKFETELDSFFDILEQNPHFPIRYNNFRSVPMDIFSYLVILSLDEVNSEVEVKAVFHTSQNSDKYP